MSTELVTDYAPRDYHYDSGDVAVYDSLRSLVQALTLGYARLVVHYETKQKSGNSTPVLNPVIYIKHGSSHARKCAFAAKSNEFVQVKDFIGEDGKVKQDNSNKMTYPLVSVKDCGQEVYDNIKDNVDTLEDFTAFWRFVAAKLTQISDSQTYNGSQVSVHSMSILKFTIPKHSTKVGGKITYDTPIEMSKYTTEEGFPIFVLGDFWELSTKKGTISDKLIGFTMKLHRTKYLSAEKYQELVDNKKKAKERHLESVENINKSTIERVVENAKKKAKTSD